MTMPLHPPPPFPHTPQHSPFHFLSLLLPPQFSPLHAMFSHPTELSNIPTHPFDPAARADDSCGGWRAMDLSCESRKTVLNSENYRSSHGGEVQFRADDLGDESGICSPPLWKTSPSRSPSHPRQHHRQNNHRHQSPPSRAQAIARGQRELMEMVKNMPESSYELSLKDIVEQTGTETQEECLIGEKNMGRQSSIQRVPGLRRQESGKAERKVKIVRSGSMENKGLMLNMVFPVALGSKTKKKSAATKVSPKPEAAERSLKGVDKEWWKKRFSASVESESSGTSSRSGSRGSSSSSSRSSSSRSNSGRYEIFQEISLNFPGKFYYVA